MRPSAGEPGAGRAATAQIPNSGFSGYILSRSGPPAIPEIREPTSRADKKKARRRQRRQIKQLREIQGANSDTNDEGSAMPNMETARDHFTAYIDAGNFPFSKSKNRIFGPFQLAAILAYMILYSVCANTAIAAFWADAGIDPKKEIKRKSKRKVRFPTDQWLFKLLGSISPEEMEERCDLMLDAQMRVIRDASMMKDIVIDIIDVHNIAHYGKKDKDDKHIVRTKAKDGTSRAESYATVLTTSGDYPYCAAATRVVAKRSKSDIVSKLLDDRTRRGINSVLTLLDRGFFAVGVMKAFADRGRYFLMGAVRTASVKRALDEYIAGEREAISRCTIRSGRESFEFTLIIVEKIEVDEKTKEENKVHILYATNLPDEIINAPGIDIDKLYGKRWDIETHYRKLEEVRPRTVSRSHGARTFFFFCAAVALNLWSMYNQRENDALGRANPVGAAGAGAGGPPPPSAAVPEGGEEEGGEEEGGEEEGGEEEGGNTDAPAGSGSDDCAIGRGEIVCLALKVQNREKREYHKIAKIYFVGFAASFRKVILSWHYYRHKVARRIEEFWQSSASAF